MQRGENRILTTHAGSLPRPAALTTLFAKRIRGEAVDPAAINAEGRVVRAIVKKQIETGLDVIDDGEQSRESFVLYLRHRQTGLGGSGSRPMHADLDRCPMYKADFQQRTVGKDTVSNRAMLPKAIGAITYTDSSAIETECSDFRAALEEAGGTYAEPVLTAPSPGIIASLANGQLIVAGVIDTQTNFVEHPQVVADRIERVAGTIGDPSRVLAGTDCGFDTYAGMGRVAEDLVWAKLRGLTEGARIASRRLFAS